MLTLRNPGYGRCKQFSICRKFLGQQWILKRDPNWDFRRGPIGSWFQWKRLKDLALVWSMVGLKENTWGWRECLNMEWFPSIHYNKDIAWFCDYLNKIDQKQGFLLIFKEYCWPKAFKFKKMMTLFHVKNPCIVVFFFFLLFLSFFWELIKQTNVK